MKYVKRGSKVVVYGVCDEEDSIKVDRLITHGYPLDDYAEALGVE